MCSCRKGYKVDDDDEKNCVDVDECEFNAGYDYNGRFVTNGNIFILPSTHTFALAHHMRCVCFSKKIFIHRPLFFILTFITFTVYAHSRLMHSNEFTFVRMFTSNKHH
jgi:hypothetical protein